jgi:SAM-dependent methyltransferase
LISLRVLQHFRHAGCVKRLQASTTTRGVPMATADLSTITRTVRRQYEDLPYPQRNPEDEKTRLCQTSLDELSALNHYCYHGKKNFRNGFRALVAGGGTGDSLIYLGHQLSATDAELVYLDLSEASMEIARRRARCRGFEHKVYLTRPQTALLRMTGN